MADWTVETLKAHFEELLSEREARYKERFDAQNQALLSALTSAKEYSSLVEQNNKLWREAANEWRAAMSDREREFAKVTELKSLAELVDKLEKKQDLGEGADTGRKTTILNQKNTIAIGASVLGVLVVIIIFLINAYASKS
jgi:hypothetical protein